MRCGRSSRGSEARDRLVIRTIAGGSRTTHVSITISRVRQFSTGACGDCPSGLCGCRGPRRNRIRTSGSLHRPRRMVSMVGPCLGYRHDSRRGLFAIPRTPWAEGRLASAERAGISGDRSQHCRRSNRRRSHRQVDLTECGCLTRIAEHPESASGWREGPGGGRRWSRSRSRPRR